MKKLIVFVALVTIIVTAIQAQNTITKFNPGTISGKQVSTNNIKFNPGSISGAHKQFYCSVDGVNWKPCNSIDQYESRYYTTDPKNFNVKEFENKKFWERGGGKELALALIISALAIILGVWLILKGMKKESESELPEEVIG